MHKKRGCSHLLERWASEKWGGNFTRAFIAAVSVAFLFCTPSVAAAQTVDVLFLTDVHFDPFVDAGIVRRLRETRPGDWPAVMDKRQGTISFPDCGKDEPVTDAALFASAMTQISGHHFAFTILSGDLLVHEFQCRFNSLFPNADEAAYREFAARTVEFILADVRRATHGKPVYLALGNHDSGCGNYRRDDHDLFLRRIAPAVARAAGGRRRGSIARSFAAYGRYEVPAPGSLPRLSLLVVDTSLWSRRALTCKGDARTSDEGQLTWLRDRATALGNSPGRAVWLIGHIPPGMDPRASAQTGKPVRYLRDDALPLMLAQASHSVRLALFGHTHMDEWRLFGSVPVRISPALSPSSGNRPSFTIAQVTDGGGLADYTVMSYAAAARSWVKDHSFSSSFGLGGFNANTLARLNRKIRSGDEQVLTKYNKNYTAGGAPQMPELGSWIPSFRCALSALTEKEFAQCLNQGLKGNSTDE